MKPILDLTSLSLRDPSQPSHTPVDKEWIQQWNMTLLPVYVKNSDPLDPLIEGTIGWRQKTKHDKKDILSRILNLHIPLESIPPELRPTHGIDPDNGFSVAVTKDATITAMAEIDLFSAKISNVSIHFSNDTEVPKESPLHQLIPDSIRASLPSWQNGQLWLALKFLAGAQARRENSADDISLQQTEQMAAGIAAVKTTNLFRQLLKLAMGPAIKAYIAHERNKQKKLLAAVTAIPANQSAKLDKESLSILLSHPDKNIRSAAIENIGHHRTPKP